MFKILSVLLLAAAVGSAFRSPRAVNPIDICGGNGVFLELRVRDCTTPPCQVVVGEDYELEVDIMPLVSSEQVSMLVSVVLPELEFVILDTPIPESALEAMQSYTIAYPLTPDDVLLGGTFDLKLEIADTASRAVHICVRAAVTVVQ